MNLNIFDQIMHIFQIQRTNPSLDKYPVCSSRQSLTIDILKSIKCHSPTDIILHYTNNQQNKQKENSDYFKVLVQLANVFAENSGESKLCKDILQKLLQIEKNNCEYLNLVPKELFINIKKYNPLTFQRKEKKIFYKSELTLEKNMCFAENTKGFAQITLMLCNYFNHQSQQFQHVWSSILQLVGKFNLDFAKITQIIIDLLLTVSNQQKVAAIFKVFQASNLTFFLVSRLFSLSNRQVMVYYCASISQLIEKESSDILLGIETNLSSKHFPLFKLCTYDNIFKEQRLQDFLPSVDASLLLSREHQIITALNQLLEKYQSKSLDQPSLSQVQQEQKKLKRLMMGQVCGCYKFALMCHRLASNQFIQFRNIYEQLSLQKITLTLSVPIIKAFCHLIEGMVDPFLEKYSQRQFFKLNSSKQQLTFKKGYFQQISQVTLDFMCQLQEIFDYLNIYIGFSAITFQKICKVFTIFASRKTQLQDIENSQEIKQKIRNIIRSYLLGGLSLQTNNPLLSLKLSQLVKIFPQKQRFQMYQEFLKHTMFENLHLVYHLQRAAKFQNSFLNKMKFKATAKQLNPICKLQWNNPFQSLYEISKRIPNSFFQAFVPNVASVIFQSPFLSKDAVIYFCFDILSKNQQKLMKDYDAINENFKVIIYLLCQLYKRDKECQIAVCFQLALVRLKEKIDEPSAYQMVVPHYNRNFIFLKILACMLQQICPILVDSISSTSDKYEYLLQGYFMRLHWSDKVLSFAKNKVFRLTFYKALCKQHPQQRRSLLLSFLSALNFHRKKLSLYDRKHQQSASKTIQKHGKSMDECHLVSNHLIKFFFTQLALIDQYPIEDYSIPFSFEQVCELMFKEQLQFALGCSLLRQLKKPEFEQGRQLDLKKKWLKLINKIYGVASSIQNQQILIKKQKVLCFTNSDFFFNFWFCSTPHLISFQEKYCYKITQLRRKFEGKQVQGQFKEKLLFACRYIQQQKEQLRKSNNSFNGFSYTIQKQEPIIRNQKLGFPPEYSLKEKIKQETNKGNQQIFKEFVNFLFTYCLLPRLLVDPCEAIFCSKFVFRLIKQNKLPSNKSLIMVFTLIEAAVGYVQFGTERQATKCIPVFVNELLKLFKQWHNSQLLQTILLNQISMQKFTDKRYQILKEYIFDFTSKITAKLTVLKDEPYIARNIILFLDKTDQLPLTYQQGEDILLYLRQVIQNLSSNLSIKIAGQRLLAVLESRMKATASTKAISINRQTKIDASKAKAVAEMPQALRPKKQAQVEKEAPSSNSTKMLRKTQQTVVIDLEQDVQVASKPKEIKLALKSQPSILDKS